MDAQLEQDKQLIGLLQAYTINPDCVPVELVRQLKRIERSINSLSKPLFVDNKGEQISYEHWDEFKFTGLTPTYFVLTDFFLEGWGSEKDEE